MATCLDEKLEIYWVKTEDYPWWPAQVNVDLGNDVQRVCSEEEDEASEKEDQRKDGSATGSNIRVRLLSIEKEYVYSSILLTRVTVNNPALLLPFKNHVFELKDVELSLRDSFWYLCTLQMIFSRALDVANSIINHQTNPQKNGVLQSKVSYMYLLPPRNAMITSVGTSILWDLLVWVPCEAKVRCLHFF